MLERAIEKHELVHFVGDVTSSWTNPQIFAVCRHMQDEARKQKIELSNLGNVYHWVIEMRDELKNGKKPIKRRKKKKSQ